MLSLEIQDFVLRKKNTLIESVAAPDRFPLFPLFCSCDDSVSKFYKCSSWSLNFLVIAFWKRVNCRWRKASMLSRKFSCSLYPSALPKVVQSLQFSREDFGRVVTTKFHTLYEKTNSQSGHGMQKDSSATTHLQHDIHQQILIKINPDI